MPFAKACLLPLLLFFTGTHNGRDKEPSDVTFQVPSEPNMLFYLQRTPNENTVIYAVRPAPLKEPIDIYWKRHRFDWRREELNYIQRTFAYGMKVKDKGDRLEMRSVAYDKFPIIVYKHADGQLQDKAFLVVNDHAIILHRIFIAINGGTFWFPNVEHVEFSGIDPRTNSPVVERFVQ